jgi:tRNA A-37 threonylcarbamoyl transferase component Bud32
MADEKTCPHCGKPVPPTALGGICPECMLKAGLAAQTEGPGATGPHGTKVLQPPPSPAEIASLFPQLEILECLGRGGMGVVYKARQPRLNRLVALKILARDKEQDAQFTERFTREAQALARLSHPNIVTVHDFGEAGGHCYLVMEFVDGLSLRQLLQAGKMQPEQALTIVPKICEALQYAHEQGIVHRDIKPENILLDKQGRVKIADFGIAKMVGAETRQPALTGAKDVVGTPHYMAPEQIEKPQTVDHRADIYSLGVVFYEMLTGELPLGKFQPPSHKVQIDVRLDEVVLRALEKEPERRYQQVSVLKTQVETIAAGSAAPKAFGAAPVAIAAFTREILARDYVLDIGSCLRRGWALLRNNFWPVVGITALIVLLRDAADSTLIGIVVGGPLMGGLWLYFLKKVREEQAGLETAFSGFSIAFLHLFLAGMITMVLTVVGVICLILPGIYLAIAWLFTLPLVIDQRLDFWPAMELSRKTISKHWWKFLGFIIILGLINLAGLLACFIGLFVTVPLSLAALMYAYEDIFGPAARAANLSLAGSPAAPHKPVPAKPADPLLAYVALYFPVLSGILGIAAYCFRPPSAILVWSILAPALVGVALGILTRRTRTGKKALFSGSMAVIVWLVVALVVNGPYFILNLRELAHRGRNPGVVVAQTIQREVGRQLREAGADFDDLQVTVAEERDSSTPFVVNYRGLRNFNFTFEGRRDPKWPTSADGHFIMQYIGGGRWQGALGDTKFTVPVGRTDNINLPFVNDPPVIGEWESVDFVADISDFNPDQRIWDDELFLKGLTFLENGKTTMPWWTWTRGVLIHHGDQTASHYEIREIKGQSYMFLEWKSGDVMISGMKPHYYVLRKKVAEDTP